MKKIFDIKKMGAIALGLVAFAPAASAQDEVETTIAADVVNQYIWRGQDLGNVSLQPTLGIGYKGFSLTLNGILAGLVAITAGCDVVSPVGSAIIGLLAGIILVFSIEFIDTKLHIDDPVGASSVHGVCGIFGTLMTGLFALDGGAFYGGGFGFFGAQCFGILCIDLWAAVTGIILFWGIKKIAGLRVDKRIEEEGLDIYEHGESCYN